MVVKTPLRAIRRIAGDWWYIYLHGSQVANTPNDSAAGPEFSATAGHFGRMRRALKVIRCPTRAENFGGARMIEEWTHKRREKYKTITASGNEKKVKRSAAGRHRALYKNAHHVDVC